MTESDYLAATNLAKARLAKVIIYDMLFLDTADVELQSKAQGALSALINKLAPLVDFDLDESDK